MTTKSLLVAILVVAVAVVAFVVLLAASNQDGTQQRATAAPCQVIATPAAPKPGEDVTFTLSDGCSGASYRWYDQLADGPGTNDVLLATTTEPTYTRVGGFKAEGSKYIRVDVLSTSDVLKLTVSATAGPANPPTPEPTPTPEPPAPTPTPEPTPPATAGVCPDDGVAGTWCGSPEAPKDSAYGQWATVHAYSPSDIVDAGNFQGRRAWKMTVVPGKMQAGTWQRSEYGQDGNAARKLRVGQDVWVGWSVWMPAGFPNNLAWTALTQFKDQDPDLGSPSWGNYVEKGKIGFGGVLAGGDIGLYSQPATLETWHNFVVHLKLGTSASTGHIDLFYSTGDNKPVQVINANRQTYRTSSVMVPRMGYYRPKDTSVTASVYHAGYAMGRNFDEVNPVR